MSRMHVESHDPGHGKRFLTVRVSPIVSSSHGLYQPVRWRQVFESKQGVRQIIEDHYRPRVRRMRPVR